MTDNLPKEVSRGTMMIGDLEIEVVHLDNGQRIVTAESMERFLGWMAGEVDAVPMKDVTPAKADRNPKGGDAKQGSVEDESGGAEGICPKGATS